MWPHHYNKQLLDQPNLMYIVNPIHKIEFKDLDFFISNRGALGKIPKIIIFVDKINNAVQIAKYLYSRFFEHIQKENRPNHIIHIFMTNFTTISKTQILADFCFNENWIWICTEYMGMGINLSDIRCTIQFKISNYIMLSELLQ